jgi:hypothetical protein
MKWRLRVYDDATNRSGMPDLLYAIYIFFGQNYNRWDVIGVLSQILENRPPGAFRPEMTWLIDSATTIL